MLSGACPLRARAQGFDCGESVDPLEELHVQPGDTAVGVALDAPVVVRYAQGVDLDALQQTLDEAGAGPDPDACQSQLVCLFYDASAAGQSTRERVSARLERVDAHTVVLTPDTQLRKRTHYFSSIARAGFDRAARTELELTTGTSTDREPPSFDADRSKIALSVEAPPAECHAPAGSLRVALALPRASDDGDEQSVEFLLFLTRAAGLRGPLLRARARNPAPEDGGARLSFLLQPRETRTPVCVALRAVDGVGRLAQSEPELCFDPLRGSFFAPCAVAGAPGAAHGLSGDDGGRSLIALVLVAAAALLVRSRGPKTRPV